ncbi:hypothetical protein R2103_09010 [Nitrosomonas sp. Is24]|uniref:hypothetical protein n=1 Tax=Nitrosomonas sp. Is24 TaxID=3080533 RepID=UPI00294B67AD|nr:hypothetical protein [Nitrosomonas sp. Is24]MDV6341902.1 hypothetical protein [Nitrosomonas sp. Is24]
MINKLFIILVFLISSGCASVYKAPNDKPIAFLELDSNFLPVNSISHFADEQCAKSQNGIRLMLGRLEEKFDKYVDSHGITKPIEANQRFLLSFHVRNDYGTLPGYNCTANGSFYPRPGVTYRTTFRLYQPPSIFDREECYLGILRKVINGNTVSYVPEESYQDSKSKCYDD